jgi:hypothetical protein
MQRYIKHQDKKMKYITEIEGEPCPISHCAARTPHLAAAPVIRQLAGL